MITLANNPSKRGAAVTMLGKTVELAAELVRGEWGAAGRREGLGKQQGGHVGGRVGGMIESELLSLGGACVMCHTCVCVRVPRRGPHKCSAPRRRSTPRCRRRPRRSYATRSIASPVGAPLWGGRGAPGSGLLRLGLLPEHNVPVQAIAVSC